MRPPPSASDTPFHERVVNRLPQRTRQVVSWLVSRWPGRIAIRSATASFRIELFDRSMAIAAQAFTSLFPILIALASWLGRDSGHVTDALGLPSETKSVLDEALGGNSTNVAFGIIGTVIVLASATSLSRSLTRAMSAIWLVPRPATRLAFAWRWVAVVLALAGAVIVVRHLGRFADDLPPQDVWQPVVSLACDIVVGVLVPWLLLSGAIKPRHLLSGALLFGLVMMVVRPASELWLPHALDVSADRYGSIGVAFTYLAWLYVVSWCYLVANVIGHVVTSDDSRFGQWIRGPGYPATAFSSLADEAGRAGPREPRTTGSAPAATSDPSPRAIEAVGAVRTDPRP